MKHSSVMCAAALCLCALPASADQYSVTTAVGGMKGTTGGFDVICDPMGCFEGSFSPTAGAVASVTGAYDLGGVAFSGWAEGWHTDLLTLHAGAGLSVEGTTGVEGHRWFAQTAVSVDTTLVGTWADPATATMLLYYQFDGNSSSTATGAAHATAAAGVMGSTFDLQAIICQPMAGLPGQCVVSIPDRVSGEVFDYGVTLQAVTSLEVTAPGGTYGGNATADYRHTLAWVGAALVNQETGASIGGWTLARADGGGVLFSSPVPEPATALLLPLGLAALARRRLCR